jgi:Ca2+-binding RTX toxin-like protein
MQVVRSVVATALAIAAGGLLPIVVMPAAHAADGCGGAVPTIVGTDGDEVLVGTSGVDVIDGLGGDDTISGLAGDDVICGGSGHDAIYGDTETYRQEVGGGRGPDLW